MSARKNIGSVIISLNPAKSKSVNSNNFYGNNASKEDESNGSSGNDDFMDNARSCYENTGKKIL